MSPRPEEKRGGPSPEGKRGGPRAVPAGVVAGAALLVVALAFALGGAGCATGGEPASAKKKGGPLQHYQLGRMYFEQGRVNEAVQEIDTSLRLDPTLPQVWFYRGYIRWTLEQWAEAEKDFRKALEVNPYYTDARMYLATTRDRQGDLPGALAELDRALLDKAFATPEKIHLTKARILRREKQTEEALASLRAAVTARPRFYEAHYEMGGVLVELGRMGEAETAYRAAEPGYTKNAEYHLRLGETLFNLRRRSEAAAELRRAVELSPGSEAAARAAELLKVIG